MVILAPQVKGMDSNACYNDVYGQVMTDNEEETQVCCFRSVKLTERSEDRSYEVESDEQTVKAKTSSISHTTHK